MFLFLNFSVSCPRLCARRPKKIIMTVMWNCTWLAAATELARLVVAAGALAGQRRVTAYDETWLTRHHQRLGGSKVQHCLATVPYVAAQSRRPPTRRFAVVGDRYRAAAGPGAVRGPAWCRQRRRRRRRHDAVRLPAVEVQTPSADHRRHVGRDVRSAAVAAAEGARKQLRRQRCSETSRATHGEVVVTRT